MEGLGRLCGLLLGERERELEDGVKDLARSSPRSGVLRLLPSALLRGGGGDLLGE